MKRRPKSRYHFRHPDDQEGRWELRHVLTVGKNLLSSNISSRCPHNMVNFGPLAAEIGPVV